MINEEVEGEMIHRFEWDGRQRAMKDFFPNYLQFN
jgi:hypothetical protein